MDSCSADPSSSHHQPSLAPDDVNEILRQKRKTRLQRACYPCRQRKVKCDNATPCQTCKDRQHSQLCTYEPPSKRIDDGSSHRSSSCHAPAIRSPITHDKVLKKLEHLEHYIQDIKGEVRVLATVPGDQSSLGPSLPAVSSTDGTSTVRDIEDEDIYARSGVTGDAVYYGANSVLATITALRNSGNEAVRQNLAENNTLSLLGLGNRNATYPFVDLGVMAHGSLSRMQELCKLLPTNAEILQHFRQYRDNVHPLYPGIVALPEFEADLVSFLARRAAAPCDVGDCCLSERNVFGATLHWVALLFGVLSSSCQWSTMCARKQPDAASQVFGKSRYRTLPSQPWFGGLIIDSLLCV